MKMQIMKMKLRGQLLAESGGNCKLPHWLRAWRFAHAAHAVAECDSIRHLMMLKMKKTVRRALVEEQNTLKRVSVKVQ
jgi:hypothetical protein